MSTCTRCPNGKPIPGRSICIDCHRAQQRVIAREYARRKRNGRRDTEACCCRDPGCNGLRCESLRYGTAA